MIEELLPDAVASADAFDDSAAAPLYPEEEEIVARAVESRRLAFATARTCARRALEGLGHPPVAIPRLEKRAPLWPPGIVGSITHCDGYRAAAVAWERDLATVGIDAEPNAPLPDGVIGRVASEEERERVAALSRDEPSVCWDRLLFGVKESTYKAWFPLKRAWLGFEHADVTIDPGGTFESRLLVPGPSVGGHELGVFEGRWAASRGLVVSAIAVPAAPDA